MGWFARYGIPGTYFLLDSLLWIFLLVPKFRPCVLSIGNELAALFALSAVPCGYILTIINQYLYLRKKDGANRRALETCPGKITPKDEDDEATIEADMICRMYISDEAQFLPEDSVDSTEYVRGWIRRRVDILVINGALRLATKLVLIAAAFGGGYLAKKHLVSYSDYNLFALIFLFALTVILLRFLRLSTQALEKQVTKVLSRFYKKKIGASHDC